MRLLAVTGAAAVMTAALAEAAYAAPGPVILAAASVSQVVHNIQAWLTGILAAVATLFLVVGGVRYLMAGGDPSEIDKAKQALKSAAIGYGLAVLAPVLVQLVGQWVGA
jgi:predicted small integral membrane protein